MNANRDSAPNPVYAIPDFRPNSTSEIHFGIAASLRNSSAEQVTDARYRALEAQAREHHAGISQNISTDYLEYQRNKEESDRLHGEIGKALLDKDFRDERSAAERWLRVLSSAERLAALYAFLSQADDSHLRFLRNMLQHRLEDAERGPSPTHDSALYPSLFGELTGPFTYKNDPLAGRAYGLHGMNDQHPWNEHPEGVRSAADAKDPKPLPDPPLIPPRFPTLAAKDRIQSPITIGNGLNGPPGLQQVATDPELAKDIPAWLRAIRLHKYTENLKDLKWQEILEMGDSGLEARGVRALGARNKILATLNRVKAEDGRRSMLLTQEMPQLTNDDEMVDSEPSREDSMSATVDEIAQSLSSIPKQHFPSDGLQNHQSLN